MSKLIKVFGIIFSVAAVVLIIMVVSAFFNPTPSIDDGVPRPDLDSYKITELTDEQIISIHDYSRSFISGTERCGDKSGIGDLEGLYKYREFDRKHCNYHAKKVKGIVTVNATLVKDNTVSFDIRSSIGSGEAIIVVIKDGEIIDTFDFEDNRLLKYDVEGKHYFLIKALFENAEGVEIDVVRAYGAEIPSIDH